MTSPLQKISFVSGKGGVGKTFLAVNFAWVCSHLAKTLLLDLDFQNQGATGLLSSFIHETDLGAVDYILGPHLVANETFLYLAPNLFFLPAVPLNNPPCHSELFEACRSPEFQSRLKSFLAKVGELGFQFVVMDCHGGLDMVSLASHRLSDHTLVITEADRVTFNGTLELLDFYQSADPGTEPGSTAAERPSHPVDVIVNRVPPKYRFNDLNRVYAHALSKYKDLLNLSDRVLLYIPAEEVVADSFGDTPFLCPVAPNSVVTRKLNLLAYHLFSGSPGISFDYEPVSKFASPKRRTKVERIVVSAQNRNLRAIVDTFAAITCACLFLSVGSILYNALRLVFVETVGGIGRDIATSGVLFFLSLILIVYLRAVFGLIRYYRDKYQVERNLARLEHGSVSLWRRLSIARLFFLRVVMTTVPVVVILALLLFSLTASLLMLHKI